ncbi:response regulator transcription factor [Phenylobacterium sp. VNQ135]|uniref:response regulator transcription factor n=1 Tax=Phenylobacterium sp. VNQ135 TaxID=3400922 RepID=UPI003BFF8CE9
MTIANPTRSPASQIPAQSTTRCAVHIVEDDSAIGKALTALLAPQGHAVSLHSSAEAFLAALPGLPPGCILADIRLPGMSGLDLIKRLKAIGAPHPVIVISGHGDVDLVVEAMKSGAADYLQKPIRAARLAETIAQAWSDQAEALAQEAERVRCAAILKTLSGRQRDVLAGIVAGKLNKEIAHELGISVRTVEGYRADLMVKTGAKSAAELARIAVLAGL